MVELDDGLSAEWDKYRGEKLPPSVSTDDFLKQFRKSALRVANDGVNGKKKIKDIPAFPWAVARRLARSAPKGANAAQQTAQLRILHEVLGILTVMPMAEAEKLDRALQKGDLCKLAEAKTLRARVRKMGRAPA